MNMSVLRLNVERLDHGVSFHHCCRGSLLEEIAPLAFEPCVDFRGRTHDILYQIKNLRVVFICSLVEGKTF